MSYRVRLPKGWKEWLRSYFIKNNLRYSVVQMAKYGREQYGIVVDNKNEAIKQLAVILLDKQAKGQIANVSILARFGRLERSAYVEMPEKYGIAAVQNIAVKAFFDRKKIHNKTKAKKNSSVNKKDVDFYDSWEWKTLRYKVLQKYGARCMLCGRGVADGVKICVDHIKPRALFPELELEESNLQVLCNDCNMGKGRWDETDWRKKQQPDIKIRKAKNSDTQRGEICPNPRQTPIY